MRPDALIPLIGAMVNLALAIFVLVQNCTLRCRPGLLAAGDQLRRLELRHLPDVSGARPGAGPLLGAVHPVWRHLDPGQRLPPLAAHRRDPRPASAGAQCLWPHRPAFLFNFSNLRGGRSAQSGLCLVLRGRSAFWDCLCPVFAGVDFGVRPAPPLAKPACADETAPRASDRSPAGNRSFRHQRQRCPFLVSIIIHGSASTSTRLAAWR